MELRTATVAGAGIVGIACALALQRAGLRVALLRPPETALPASWGNAGHLAFEQVEPLASPRTFLRAPALLAKRRGPVVLPPAEWRTWLPFLLRMARCSTPGRFGAGTAALAALMQRAPDAWEALLEDSGDRRWIVRRGHFLLWESPRSARRGRSAWAAANTGRTSFRDATNDELARFGDLLRRRPAGAIRFEGTCQVTDPGRVLEGLGNAFRRAGGAVVPNRVTRLRCRRRRAAFELDDGSVRDCDILVIAAGAWSGGLLADVGLRMPLIAERGYHIQQAAAAWPTDLPSLVFEDREMIVTLFECGLRASGFLEFAPPGRTANPRHWDALFGHAAALGLPFTPDASAWMGCRPTLPDYLPVIGRVAASDNLHCAFGHQHLGLTLAPVTGELVAAVALGRPPAIDLEAFAPERFS